MTLLVVGANGLVGSALVAVARERGISVAGTYHSDPPQFDIQFEQHDIRNWPPSFDLDRFDAIVNCAAMTDVDECERNPERAQAVNAAAPGAIAESCDDRSTPLVHLSTDYVFDGTTEQSYDEEVEPNPIQAYGRSKLAGERAVERASEDAILLRLSFVYGVHGATGELTGFPAWVVNNLRSGESVPLFVDQHVTPSRAGQIATVILDLLEESTSGLYHAASRSCVTPYEFGYLLAEQIGIDPSLLDEATTAALDRPADRPTNTCLSSRRLERRLDRRQPTLRTDIEAIADAI